MAQKPAPAVSSYPAQEQTVSPSVEPEQTPSETPSIAPAKSPEISEPEGVEEPKETPAPQEIAATPEAKAPLPEKMSTCTLSVRCDDVLIHIDKLPEAKRGIIPENGVIFQEQAIAFSEGESVFDVLLRELKKKKIHLEFVNNPMYNSVYIEGIGNLYEFDCGDTSGWLYTVNGVEPRYGCSNYILKSGDRIEFFYRCSMFN